MSILVAPSLLSADPLQLGADIKKVEQFGADWHHVDIMDGNFVPNLTYGPSLVKSLKGKMKIPLDVHIMVSNPEEIAPLFLEAGADHLTFHAEAATHSHRLIEQIQSRGVKAGVALNPGTSVSAIEELLPYVDIVTIMSVNPGFGGQKFIDSSIAKVARVADSLDRLGRKEKVHIQVDGGINQETGPLVAKAGADVLVAGTFVYKSNDPKEAINSLKNI